VPRRLGELVELDRILEVELGILVVELFDREIE
jgi:hypothetical protein